MKNKIAAIIGGSGFIGINVARDLLKRKYKVKIIDVKKPKLNHNNLSYNECDISDKKKLTKLLNKVNIVYHFAGLADIKECRAKPEKTIEINLIGTLNILNACKLNKVPSFIFSSSMYVYSDKGSIYRVSKFACEEMIVDFFNAYKKGKFLILRYGSIYGKESQTWNSLNSYINEIYSKNSIHLKGTEEDIRQYIHISDAARMTVDLSLKNNKNNFINLTGNEKIKISELLKIIREITGKKFKVFYNKNLISDHYSITPYKSNINFAKQATLKEFTDIGQGLLELINDKENKKNN